VYTFLDNLKKFRSPERAAFEDEIARKELEARDRTSYREYEKQMTAERLTPLSYEEWAKFLPDSDDPATRGSSTSNRAAWTQLTLSIKERIGSQQLDDEELAELGFDLRHRPNWELSYTSHGIATMLEKFRNRELRFVPSLHVSPVGEFLGRNNLTLSGPHIEIAFNLLWNLNLIEPKPEPQPEPEAPKVNLAIEPDQALEERQRREAYGTRVVAKGPDGHEYTQYEIDRLSADEFKRVMRLFGENVPRFSHVLKAS